MPPAFLDEDWAAAETETDDAPEEPAAEAASEGLVFPLPPLKRCRMSIARSAQFVLSLMKVMLYLGGEKPEPGGPEPVCCW